MAPPETWTARVMEAAMRAKRGAGPAVDIALDRAFLANVLQELHRPIQHPPFFTLFRYDASQGVHICQICHVFRSARTTTSNDPIRNEREWAHEVLHRQQVVYVLTSFFCLEPSWEYTNDPSA